MRPELAARLGENVPRYASYPTAPHFHAGVDAAVHRDWLEAIEGGDEISLYLHIPYCDRLCCSVRAIQADQPLRAGGCVSRLAHAEIATVAGPVSGKAHVRAVHFGGGSPTMLKPEDMTTLGTVLRDSFDFLRTPRSTSKSNSTTLTKPRLDTLAEIGMARASLGVQDFDPKVQKAINREESFLQPKAVVDGIRSRGVGSVNLDLLTACRVRPGRASVPPLAQALTLEPDRMALFGYAHALFRATALERPL